MDMNKEDGNEQIVRVNDKDEDEDVGIEEQHHNMYNCIYCGVIQLFPAKDEGENRVRTGERIGERMRAISCGYRGMCNNNIVWAREQIQG